MTRSEISVVVINWKLREETERCLLSLEQLEYPCHIVVVDNGSADGSAEYLAERFPQVKLIALPENIGFGPACNRAISWLLLQTTSEYVFLLNNDARIGEGALDELLSAARAHPEAGILGPKVYYEQPGGYIWYAGARRRKWVLAAADTGRGRPDAGPFDHVRPVDYVFGAAMLIRRDVFERVGLFDENFFLYLEDLDFCLRSQQHGYTLLFVPQAHVHHKGSASTRENLSLRKYHHVRSTIIFLRKHLRPLWVIPAACFWFLVLGKFVLEDFWHGQAVSFASYWSGFMNGLKSPAQPQQEAEDASAIRVERSRSLAND